MIENNISSDCHKNMKKIYRSRSAIPLSMECQFYIAAAFKKVVFLV